MVTRLAMQVRIEDVSPVEKKMFVEIPWETVSEKLGNHYKELSKGVALKGFRKGKVPRPVLEQVYGSRVQAEVAYELGPAVWGRGLASAAVMAFLEHAHDAGLRRVVAHTWDGNTPSHRVLTRCGFEPALALPAFRACRGEWRDFTRWTCPLGGGS